MKETYFSIEPCCESLHELVSDDYLFVRYETSKLAIGIGQLYISEDIKFCPFCASEIKYEMISEEEYEDEVVNPETIKLNGGEIGAELEK